jgi:crotonobetainyl-CoA:carnitine CoA-transferase CaiB-like acyl-CoA transferase
VSRKPLEGIRIVESTYVYAFPYAAGLLADLGAEVIKIEGPGHIDTTRGGQFAGAFPDNEAGDDPWNRAAGFNQLNRGKKSLTLDLSKDEGQAVLKDLLSVTDIFMENYTPRVMRRWKLDYPNLKKLKPDIIMASNTGYGHGEGPYSQYPAQATTQEGTHGLVHITGYRGDDSPSKAGQSYVDFISCWAALLGISMALRYRNQTGKGQWIDIGMYQLGCLGSSEYVMDWIANEKLGGPIGNRHPWRAPQGCYQCSGKDQWCVISVGDDEEWAALCRTMGKDGLIEDPKFASSFNRVKNHEELDSIISSWTKGVEKFQVMERLQGAGVPAAAVQDSRDANLSEQYWASGFLEKVTYPEDRKMGQRVIMGRPWHHDKTKMDVQVRGPGPKLGGSNNEILEGTLGYSQAQVHELEELGIIAERPTDPRPVPTLGLDEMVRRGRYAYHDPDYKRKLGI